MRALSFATLARYGTVGAANTLIGYLIIVRRFGSAPAITWPMPWAMV